MIKIIKDGQRDFIANCNVCGCEFSYQAEDIKLSSVACPCCGFRISHRLNSLKRQLNVEDNETMQLRWNSDIGNFSQFSGNTTKIVDEQPTADVVRIVRCKDCIHRDPEDKKCDCSFQAKCGMFPMDDNDFCSYGETEKGCDE